MDIIWISLQTRKSRMTRTRSSLLTAVTLVLSPELAYSRRFNKWNQSQQTEWSIFIYIAQLVKNPPAIQETIPRLGKSAGEGIGYPLQYSWASLVAQLVKNQQQSRRPGFYPWVGKIPWRRERLPPPVFWPREFHGLYSPWGHKESDTTEQLSLHLYESSHKL